ncbi:MAG: 30S ribosomal protein S8 [Patescibacteria group bacterium]
MDPISDMLTIIRNGQKAEHKSVIMPLSKIKLEIAGILKKENYIEDYKKSGKNGKKFLEIDLRYPPIINEIKRVSRSGQRIYIKADKVKQFKSGYGLSIISTSRGLMTNKEAKKTGLGGEVLLEIW